MVLGALDSGNNESKPAAIKYCLFSGCSVCAAAVLAVIGISLLTQRRSQGFSTFTIIGVIFMSLALLASTLAVVFKRMYRYHYNRRIITSHRSMRQQEKEELAVPVACGIP